MIEVNKKEKTYAYTDGNNCLPESNKYNLTDNKWLCGEHNYLITLRENIIVFQGKYRKRLKDRRERNTFNAFHYLSTAVLHYADPSTMYKHINKSTSKVKFGADELAAICIELEDVTAIEDYLLEVKEEIRLKKELRKIELQRQLSLFNEEGTE